MIEGQMGSHPLNGADARAILGIVFDWIEHSGPTADPGELERQLREAGYGPIPPPAPKPRRQATQTVHEEVAPLTLLLASMLDRHARGWTAGRIGADLGYSERTVHTYLLDAQKRLGAATLARAVAEAARLGIIDDPAVADAHE